MEAAAIILTGGRSSRFGGKHTPAVEVDGEPAVAALTRAVRQAGITTIVVCGSAIGLDLEARASVTVAEEDPPFGGPLNGVACGLSALPSSSDRAVLILAGDMPFVTTDLITRLVHAVPRGGVRTCAPSRTPAHDAPDASAPDEPTNPAPAAAVQADGRVQYLCAAWPERQLRAALASFPSTRDLPMTAIYRDRRVRLIPAGERELIDIDTPDDLDRALRAVRRDPGSPSAHRTAPPQPQ